MSNQTLDYSNTVGPRVTKSLLTKRIVSVAGGLSGNTSTFLLIQCFPHVSFVLCFHTPKSFQHDSSSLPSDYHSSLIPSRASRCILVILKKLFILSFSLKTSLMETEVSWYLLNKFLIMPILSSLLINTFVIISSFLC